MSVFDNCPKCNGLREKLGESEGEVHRYCINCGLMVEQVTVSAKIGKTWAIVKEEVNIFLEHFDDTVGE